MCVNQIILCEKTAAMKGLTLKREIKNGYGWGRENLVLSLRDK